MPVVNITADCTKIDVARKPLPQTLKIFTTKNFLPQLQINMSTEIHLSIVICAKAILSV